MSATIRESIEVLRWVAAEAVRAEEEAEHSAEQPVWVLQVQRDWEAQIDQDEDWAEEDLDSAVDLREHQKWSKYLGEGQGQVYDNGGGC